MVGFDIRLFSALWVLTKLLPASAQQFTEIVSGFPNYPQPCLLAADFDGDGYLDVLVAGMGKRDTPATTIFRNTGGAFVDSGVVLPGLSRASAAAADFDGDGKLDLAITGLTIMGVPATVVLRNNGNTFTPVAGPFAAVFGGSVAWGDYDGDGRPDLLVTGVTSASTNGVAVTRLYHNDGHGVLTSVPHPFPNCYSGSVAWGDYNNDGKLDVIITGTTTNAGLVSIIWRNEGGGVFTDAGSNLPGMDIGFAVWGDYDNDGDLDLLFGGNTTDGWVTRVYRNDGGAFVDIKTPFTGVIWSSAAWGDFDNDGDLDALVIGYDPVAQAPLSRLYRNDAGTFVDSGQSFHNVYLGALSWLDYDKDGKLDLLVAGNTGGAENVSLYKNNNAVKNTPPAAPADLAANASGTTARLSWRAATDAQTPSSGLSYNVRVGTTSGGADVCSSQSLATGSRQAAALGNAGPRLGAELRNLRPGTTYFWSVQAVDTAWAGGPFAAEGSFTVPVPATANILVLQHAGNGFSLEGTGTPGWPYSVLAASDASAAPGAWVRLGTTTPDAAGQFTFADTNAPLAQRFYRLVAP